MINPLTWLSRRRFPYEPMIKIEISRSRLVHNLSEFRRLSPRGRIAPVLKSNAYGHGLLEIARILEAERSSIQQRGTIPFFVVDSYFEAIALRAKGIKTPLLIIGYTRPETMLNSRLHNVSYTITSLDSLSSIKYSKGPISIHLKIDTGMHRQGILPEELDEAITYFKENHRLLLQGICSHLSDADNHDASFTKQQILDWNNIVNKVEKSFPSLEYIHLSNTDGHHFSSEIKANFSRLGLGLYGLTDGFYSEIDLKPVLSMKTIITGIKKLKQRETVGYSNTFKADHDMTIATIPVGYFEGVDRRLSNIGTIQVGPDMIICPIIGRVSMNITSLDISDVKNATIGMEAMVISNNSKDRNSIQSMAKDCMTITYEIAVHLPEHLKRIIVD